MSRPRHTEVWSMVVVLAVVASLAFLSRAPTSPPLEAPPSRAAERPSRITGRVVDRTSGEALTNATVEIYSSPLDSDWIGNYICYAPGAFDVSGAGIYVVRPDRTTEVQVGPTREASPSRRR